MQKWEYCEVEVEISGTGNFKSTAWVYKEDSKHKEMKVEKYGAMFAKLGKEGWELVSAAPRPAAGITRAVNRISYLFKRPLED